jgi:surfeit locus 1 family protein
MTDHNAKQHLRFRPDWKTTVLAALLMPCLLMMGFWQLTRAQEKRELKAVFEQRKVQAPVAITELQEGQDLRYQRVRLNGEFVNDRNLFLDNKIHRGQFGYDVVSLFKLSGVDTFILVNRGWVPGDRSRRTLPTIETQSGVLEISGEIYVPAGKMLSLGSDNASDWPRVVQSLDINALTEETGLNLFPYSVRMNANMTNAFLPNWVVVNVQPEKHIAYAFQWFAMATTLVIIALLANTNLWSLIKQRKH